MISFQMTEFSPSKTVILSDPIAPQALVFADADSSGDASFSAEEMKKIAPTGYEILERLGQGGMGVVFLARQKRLKRNVALKMLLPEVASDWEFMKRLEREAVTLARLNHPNIVGCHDILHYNGRTFLVMEYVEGRLSLSGFMQRHGKLEDKHALRIILDAAKGLAYANRKNIIHRDVKPDNLLIFQEEISPGFDGHQDLDELDKIFDRRNSRAMLVDFGLAQENQKLDSATESHDGGPDSEDRHFVDKIMGSPAFMAPEQARGEPLDFRADIYALGVTLRYMLTGKNPFEGATPQEALDLKLNPNVDLIEENAIFNGEISTSCDVVDIVRKMTAWSREERYYSYEKLIADLERALKRLKNPLARGKFCMKTWIKESTAYPSRILAVTALLTAFLGSVFWFGSQLSASDSPFFLDDSLQNWRPEKANAWRVAVLDEDPTGESALMSNEGAGTIRTSDPLSTNRSVELEIRLPGPGRINLRLEDPIPGIQGELFRAEWIRRSSGAFLKIWSQGREMALPESSFGKWDPWDWMKLRIQVRQDRLVVYVDDQLAAQTEMQSASETFTLAMEASEGRLAQFNRIKTQAL